MAYQKVQPVSKQLTIVAGLSVVGFMAFGLALSSYRYALFENTLKNIEQQNLDLKHSISQDYSKLAYYQSDQYKDKYAKQNLSLVYPGEKVLIITGPNADPLSQEIAAEDATSYQQEAAYHELLKQMPVIEHWKLYLFYPEKIEQLRSAL